MINYARPLVVLLPQSNPAPRPDRTDLEFQFTVLCGNDNFSTWFYQEIMIGRCPL